ncbi:ABC transporter ATP-binding protein [Nakamurella deserti]|uniref:ABC transporter ATP-binding protein n=1 Tax=Nakamurella deserti TaxID=2164074 RepID=UPI001F0CA4B1|nr:ABC transporter ATP-binding protein [Nakamurella deserti]
MSADQAVIAPGRSAATGGGGPAGAVSDPPPRRWVRRLFAVCWGHRVLTVVVVVAALGGLGLGALVPLLTGWVVDDAVGRDTSRIGLLVGALLVLAVVQYGLAFLRRYTGGKLSLAVQHDLRQRIFASMQTFDGALQDQLRTGQIVSRANTDLGLVQGLLAFLPLAAGQAVLFAVSLIVMVVLSPLLSLVVVVMVPLVVWVVRLTRRRLFPAGWAAQQTAADVTDIVEENVTGVRVVKGFGQEDRETGRLRDGARTLFAQKLRVARTTAALTPAFPLITTVGQIGVLGFGGLLAMHGDISLGTFVAFNGYVFQIVGPTRTVALLLTMAQQARSGVERVFEVIDSRSTVTDPVQPTPLPAGSLGVDLTGVGFGYLADEPVLDDFDLHVRPGETVALVGASGSGKSTISLLLPRFYDPARGTVALGGVDVRTVSLLELRAAMGVVFEEAFLFSASVRDNLAYGRPDATDEQIHRAALAAEADEFIRRLPEGYDTVIGERGLTLSGGQRQRLALARALLTDPRLLILDDATSAVDPTTEAAIHATLRAVTAERTTLLIAHRRSTLDLADRIALVDRGRVTDIGTAAELRARSPRFAGLLDGMDADGPVATGTGPLAVDDDRDAPGADGTTPALWPALPDDAGPDRAVPGGGDRIGPAHGGGRPGGGGMMAGGGMFSGMPATPELLEQLRALPPARDVPADETSTDADAPFRLRNLLRGVRWLLLAALVLVALDGAAGLALPALIRYGVDHGVTVAAAGVLGLTCLTALTVAVLTLLVERAQGVASSRAGETVLYQLRVRSFRHLQRLGLDFYERQQTGRILTRMTTDIDALSTFLQTGLVSSVVSLVTFVGIIVVLLVMDLPLALLAFTTLPVIVVATLVFRRISAKAYDDAREKVSVVNADLAENAAGLRVAQALGRSERNSTAFAARSADYQRSRMRAQTAISIYFPGIVFLSQVAAAVVLGVGAGQVAAGTLSVGTLLAFVLYLDSFFAPIQQLSQAFDGYQQAAVGLSRIRELLATPVSTPRADAPRPVDRLDGRIDLAEVGFHYAGESREAMTGVDLHVEPGITVAVVGATGAGKSTLVKLIARFYDVTAGSLRVDGVDVRDYDLPAYRRRLGVVPQENHLFRGSVRDNIAYGRPDATDAEVEAAARAVGAVDAISRLPGRFRHPVTDRGRNMSAGQRQLVALARAQLVDPDILLLDEATAALDPAAEAAVLQATDRLARGRTTVVVAHRMTTAARSDLVVVMAGGRVVQQGPHAALLAVPGPYADLNSGTESVPRT